MTPLNSKTLEFEEDSDIFRHFNEAQTFNLLGVAVDKRK